MNILCGLLFACSLTGKATVHDGDTLAVQGQSIRLAGVDAEELSEPNGPAARIELISVVQGHTLTCEPKGKSYNRVVAVCHTEQGININAEIIRHGYALDCARYSGGEFRRYEPEGARGRLIQKRYC